MDTAEKIEKEIAALEKEREALVEKIVFESWSLFATRASRSFSKVAISFSISLY